MLAGALAALLLLVLAAGLRWLLAALWRRRRGAEAPRALLAIPDLAALLLLFVALRHGAGAPEPALVAPAPARPDLVLVTLDTLRADHVGAIGGARRAVQTPALDALAREGALYTRGVSPLPLTLPAHASLLTGEEPLALGVLKNGATVSAEAPLIAEALRAAGWRTGAFVSAAVLRGRTGLARGFERYDDRFDALDRLSELGLLRPLLHALELVPRERRGDRTLERALDWLAEADGRPSFLWLHLYDPHSPYTPPAPHDEQYAWDAPDAQGNPAEMREVAALIRREKVFFASFVPLDLRRAAARYAGEVSWTDRQVGRLLEALPEEAAVVVASDHGESLTEHGEIMSHGALVYDTTTRVPIWVRGPGYAPGARVESPVPLYAVAGTLAALAGLPPRGPTLAAALSAPWPGPPLISLAGTQQSQDFLPLQRGWEIGLRNYKHKWISRRDGALLRFEPAADPGERSDLAALAPAEERAEVEARAAELRATIAGEEAAPAALDEQTAEELRALGYVE